LQDHAITGVQDRNQWTELHHAAKLGLDGHIEVLGLYGADLHGKNAAGNTPLHICATWDQPTAAQALLAQGADREAINGSGKTPFEVAALANAQLVIGVFGIAVSGPKLREPYAQPKYTQRQRSGSLHAIKALAPRGARFAESARSEGAEAGFTAPSTPQEPSGRPDGAPSPPPSPSPLQMQVEALNHSAEECARVRIVMKKGSNGFGFRLHGSRHSATDQEAEGQMVSHCDKTGVAYAAGLRVGDRFLNVGSVDVT
jgi:SH3/ankyrin repeat-containing protein